ncbi:hypothetical protein QBC43DRAFT_337937 [Cladorrhinum sp. PSN259]|nr:hypothetical protein QBC43DRAFT_337937 [Cladorrhinum sp. PSN259]
MNDSTSRRMMERMNDRDNNAQLMGSNRNGECISTAPEASLANFIAFHESANQQQPIDQFVSSNSGISTQPVANFEAPGRETAIIPFPTQTGQDDLECPRREAHGQLSHLSREQEGHWIHFNYEQELNGATTQDSPEGAEHPRAEACLCSTCGHMKTNIPVARLQCLDCTAGQSSLRQNRSNEGRCPRGGDKPGHRGGPNCPGCKEDFSRWRLNKKIKKAEAVNAKDNGASEEEIAQILRKRITNGGPAMKAAAKKQPVKKGTTMKYMVFEEEN